MSVVRVGQIGIVVNIALRNGESAIDLTSAQSVVMNMTKPDQSVIHITPDIESPATDGNITTTLGDVLTIPGRYIISTVITFIDSTVTIYDPVVIDVYGVNEIV